jgi:hypothetical protein
MLHSYNLHTLTQIFNYEEDDVLLCKAYGSEVCETRLYSIDPDDQHPFKG